MKLDGLLVGVAHVDSPEVGHFINAPGPGGGGIVTTDCECPYCHEALLCNDHRTWGRIVALLPDKKAIVQTVPESLRVVFCRGCRQAFTMPRNAAKGGRDEA